MRQNNNKRMRGRSNNPGARRGPNPLTRSFESNGPDVKVRGTAQHIAEKYTQLARDAHTSGDRVAAESYLQHAEHYYRIIAAAHLAQQARESGVEERDDSEDEEFDTVLDRFTFRPPQSAQQQNGNNQPYPAERPAGEFAADGEQPDGDDAQGEQPRERNSQPERQGERERFPPQDRRNGERRNENGQPQRFDRNRERDRGRNNQDRNFRPRNEAEAGAERFNPDRNGNNERNFAERPPVERHVPAERPFQPRQRFPDADGGEQPVLPAFLTAPVRAIPIEIASPAPEAFAEGEGGEGRSQFRVRRPRTRRVPMAEGADAPPVIAPEPTE